MFQIRNFLLLVFIICSTEVYCQANSDTDSLDRKLIQYNKNKALSGTRELNAGDTIKADILSEIVKINFDRNTKKALENVKEQLRISKALNYT